MPYYPPSSGGGTPGGSDTQVQFNSTGAFAGITGATSDGTSLILASGNLKLAGSGSGTALLNAPATSGGTLALPAGSTTLAGLGTVQTWTAAQTFTNSDLLLLGSSTGATAFASANAGASNFTITFPAVSGTVALTSGANVASVSNSDSTLTISPTTGAVVASLNLAHPNTWTGAPTFNANVTIGSTNQLLWSTDLILTRAGVGNIRHGAADAASPVAQTISVQSVVGGTADTAGGDFTFNASQSTGTGTPGKFLFRTASAAASTASTQNALGTLLTLGPSSVLGSATTAGLTITQTWNTSGAVDAALLINVTNSASASTSALIDAQIGGASKFSVDRNGNITGSSSLTMTANVQAGSASAFKWSGGHGIISSPAAGQVQLGDANAVSPVAQLLSTQGSRSGTDSNVAGANLTISSGLGTGTATPSTFTLSAPIAVASGTGAQTQTAHITLSNTDIVLGTAAIATGANDGFLYIPSCAGTPTGTPTTFTGRVPMVFDTTNSQFWFYTGGAWKQPKTPAGAAIVTWQ